jgi:tRNA A-37 threonylcarbamoyl transferase component Bud32
MRPDARDWMRDAGFLDGGAPTRDHGRSVFHATASRENARFERGPRGTPVFEKRTRAITLSDLRKLRARAGRLTSPLLHEWTMLWLARERGIRVPEPVGAGIRRGLLFPRSDFLVTEKLPGKSLFEVLDEGGLTTPAEAGLAATAAGRAVAALHAAGIAFPGLFAKHLILDHDRNGAWTVGFLDLASAYSRARLSRGERAGDLGALAASLPFPVGPRLLARFLRSYLENGDGWELRDAWKEIANRARRFLRLRRFRSSLAPPGRSPPAATGSRHDAINRKLLDRFSVPVAGDQARPVAIADDVVEPLKRLILATFRAGVLPTGPVLPHLRWKAETLAWHPDAPLAAPRKAHVLHGRWRAFLLGREIARTSLSAGLKKSLISWLRREPIAAFAVTDL